MATDRHRPLRQPAYEDKPNVPVRSEQAASLSAFVGDALRRQLERNQALSELERVLGGRPPQEALDAVRRDLGLSSPSTSVEQVGNALEDLGAYIREQRENAQISLGQLAKLAAVSRSYLSKVERGLRNPPAEILQRIHRALRISAAEALYLDDLGIEVAPGVWREADIDYATDVFNEVLNDLGPPPPPVGVDHVDPTKPLSPIGTQ